MESLTDAQRALFVAGGCLDDYDVLKPIGKGKFSVVYKAVRKRDGQLVALKKIAIFDVMDAKAREKTLKEVRLVQSVHHPNIIEYLDAFIANNELHIAFAWAEAGDLKRQIRKANEKSVRFDERTIWRYFSQLCAAILHMHRARIMHRDLKPANIFLTLQGVVKVGDLGLGRHLSENTLEAHSKVGTPLYMSPEVLRGEGYDWKSDVWSLGCILYELAMLRSPFKSEGLNLYGLFQKINKGDFEPIDPVYSDHLRRLATQMISLSASERPSMEDVWQMCQARPSSAVLTATRERIQAQAVKQAAARAQDSDAPAQRATATATTTKAAPGVTVVRRKKGARAVAPEQAPHRPASASSAASESQQHNQDGRDGGSSRRPRSSQQSPSHTRPQSASTVSATSLDDTKRQHTEARMELTFERLKLLAYDRVLRKRVSSKHFLSDDRALAQLDPEHSPVTTAQILLLGAERAGVGPSVAHLSAPALTSGSGSDVCELLDVLCVKALEARTRSSGDGAFKRPVYVTEPVDEMEANDELEIGPDDEISDSVVVRRGGEGGGRPGTGDGADWGDSTASALDTDDDLFAHWLVVKDECRGHGDTASPSQQQHQQWPMIHARVDPAAWRRELARLAPVLRDRVAAGLQTRAQDALWRTRLEQLERNVRVIVATAPDVRQAIVLSQQTRDRETQRLAAAETRLNELLTHVRRQFRDAAAALDASRELAQSRHDRIASASRVFVELETALRATTEALDAASARVTDTSALQALKRQLRQLVTENEALATQVQVLRYYVLQKQQQQEQSCLVKYAR